MPMMGLFLADPLPPTGKMEEEITWAPEVFAFTPRALKSSLILPTSRRQQQRGFKRSWE